MTWEIGWIVWAAFTLASFAVLEWLTIRRGQTLSANLRRWMGVEPRKPWRHIGIATFVGAVLAFVAWFIPHIVG